MVQRFSLRAENYDVMEQFKVTKVMQTHAQRYNVTPTQNVTIVMNDRHEQRVLQDARWGLFPYWASDAVNTTKQAIRGKSFLYELVTRNRCVVPCSGFYGSKQVGAERDPRAMHIVLPGKPLFGVAGIFDRFRNAQGEETRVFTILTSETTGKMAEWQPSLPIVLDDEGVETWLNPKERNYDLLQMHLPHLESYMLRSYPVTNAVYDDQFESPDCILELGTDFG